MPPKTWFNAAAAAPGTTKSSVLDDAPALPGAATSAPPPKAKKNKSSAQEGADAATSFRPANAWTGKPDSRAEAAASTLSSAPVLAPVPVDPKPAPAAVEKRPVATPMPKAAAAATTTTTTTTAAAPATAGAAAPEGRGRGRGGRGAGGRGGAAPSGSSILPYLDVMDKRDPAVDILSGEQPRASLQQAEVTAVSKKLSQILRHGALEQGFPITQNGYVPLDALLGHGKFKQVTRAVMAKVTLENGKQRFRMAYGKDGAIYIRANQGHSMEGITVDMHKLTDPNEIPVAVHGTKFDVWPKILASGLNKMGRQHIHMALDVPGSSKVVSGARATSTCIIYVDVKQLVADGIEVLLSSNGVVLSPGVDGVIAPKYLIRAVDTKTNTDIWRRDAAAQK